MGYHTRNVVLMKTYFRYNGLLVITNIHPLYMKYVFIKMTFRVWYPIRYRKEFHDKRYPLYTDPLYPRYCTAVAWTRNFGIIMGSLYWHLIVVVSTALCKVILTFQPKSSKPKPRSQVMMSPVMMSPVMRSPVMSARGYAIHFSSYFGSFLWNNRKKRMNWHCPSDYSSITQALLPS